MALLNQNAVPSAPAGSSSPDLTIAAVKRTSKGVTSIMLTLAKAPGDALAKHPSRHVKLVPAGTTSRKPHSLRDIAIRHVRYVPRTRMLTIALARPYKGALEVEIRGSQTEQGRGSSSGTLSIVVP